jgi:hypothetical protein
LFDEKFGHRLGKLFKESELTTNFNVSVTMPYYEVYDNNEATPDLLPEIDKLDGAPVYDSEFYNGYITAEVLLPLGDELRDGRVVKRKADGNGKPLGKSNLNPILDTREYEVEFGDGE